MALGQPGMFEPGRLYHLGVAVHDIDKTIKFYQEVFGIGPFEVRMVDYPNATYMGEPAGYRGKRAFAKLGDLTLELMELVDGKTIHEEFLKTRGEGLHHLGFLVDDLQKSLDLATKHGLKITQSVTRADGSGFAYLDSDKIGGVVFEVVKKQS